MTNYTICSVVVGLSAACVDADSWKLSVPVWSIFNGLSRVPPKVHLILSKSRDKLLDDAARAWFHHHRWRRVHLYTRWTLMTSICGAVKRSLMAPHTVPTVRASSVMPAYTAMSHNIASHPIWNACHKLTTTAWTWLYTPLLPCSQQSNPNIRALFWHVNEIYDGVSNTRLVWLVAVLFIFRSCIRFMELKEKLNLIHTQITLSKENLGLLISWFTSLNGLKSRFYNPFHNQIHTYHIDTHKDTHQSACCILPCDTRKENQ